MVRPASLYEDPCFCRLVLSKGADAVIAGALVKEKTSPTAAVSLYVIADIQKITYTIYREYRGKVTAVPGYSNQTLAASDVFYNTAQTWSKTTDGYNFLHVIDQSILKPLAKYRVEYIFTIKDSISGLDDEDVGRYAEFDYLGIDEGPDPEPDEPDPDPDPVEDDGVDALIFSPLTPWTVEDSASEQTLLHPAELVQILANTWIEGGVFSGSCGGVISTNATLPGGIRLEFAIAGDVVLNAVIDAGDMPGNQDNQPWSLEWHFLRHAEGDESTGTVSGRIRFEMETEAGEVIVRTAHTGATPVNLASDTSVAVTLNVEWDTADADNSITRLDFVGRMAEVPVEA